MKTVIIILLSFVIGLSVSKFSKDPKPEAPLNSSIKVKDELSKKIESIAEFDLKEYLALKESKEKYEKADEILGKVMVIFLANVGLEAKQNIERLNEKDEKREDSIEESNEAANPKEGLISDESIEGDSLAETDENIHKKKKTYLEKVAQRMKYKDLSVFLKSKPFKRKNGVFNRINGRFKGAIKNRIKENQVLDEEFVLDVSYQQVDDKLDGTFFLDISRDGVSYSKNKGSGGNGNIKRDPENHNYIIIEAAPGAYMQLRYLKNKKMFIGNYYVDGKVYFITNVKKD